MSSASRVEGGGSKYLSITPRPDAVRYRQCKVPSTLSQTDGSIARLTTTLAASAPAGPHGSLDLVLAVTDPTCPLVDSHALGAVPRRGCSRQLLTCLRHTTSPPPPTSTPRLPLSFINPLSPPRPVQLHHQASVLSRPPACLSCSLSILSPLSTG